MILHVANNLYRSPRPKSVAELKAANIQVVICLESGIFELLHDDKYELEKAECEDILFTEIDCSTKLPPTKQAIESALNFIKKHPANENILIHCKAGKDRTGFLVAVYRMKVCGWSFDDAYAEWLKLGRHWYYFWWKSALKKYAP
jgi:protein tyrosine/serine phosphatase